MGVDTRAGQDIPSLLNGIRSRGYTINTLVYYILGK